MNAAYAADVVQIGFIANNTCKIGNDLETLDFSCKYPAKNKKGNTCGLQAPCAGYQEIGGENVVIKGYCEAYAKCKATSYRDGSGKEHSVDAPELPGGDKPGVGDTQPDTDYGSDPAKQTPADLTKTPSLSNNPMGNLGGANGNDALSKAVSGETWQSPSLYDVYEKQPLFNSSLQTPGFPADATNLPQTGVTYDFGSTAQLSPTAGSSFMPEDPIGSVAPPQTFAPTQVTTGFEQPSGTLPSASPKTQQGPGSQSNSAISIPNMPASNPWSTQTQTPPPSGLAPIDAAFEPQSKFNTDSFLKQLDTDWSKAAPVEYPYLSGEKIASGQIGPDDFDRTAQSSSPDGIIRTPQDISTSLSAMDFKPGTVLESSLPTLAFDTSWTNVPGVGNVSYNIGAFTHNCTDIGCAYEIGPAGIYSFGPTAQQLLAQTEAYENSGNSYSSTVDVPVHEATSVAIGTPPSAPETFPDAPAHSVQKPEPASEQAMRGTIYYPGCVDGPKGCDIKMEGGLLGSRNNAIDTNLTIAAGRQSGLNYGDVVRISNPDTGQATYAVVGDVCPACGKGIDMTPGVAQAVGLTQQQGVGSFAVGIIEKGVPYTSGLEYAANINALPNTGSQVGYAEIQTPSVTDAANGLPNASVADPVTATPGRPSVPVSLGIAESLPLSTNVPIPMTAPYPKAGAASGYTGGSVSEYFKSIGQDPSYAFRKEVATAYGIRGFRGTASQNSQLLRLMRGY